jgi:hypothetical protein
MDSMSAEPPEMISGGFLLSIKGVILNVEK